MQLIEVLAVVNTAHESLEMTRWISVNEGNVKQIEKEMMALAQRIYPKLSRTGKKENNMMIAIGSEILDVPAAEAEKLRKAIHYALYAGHCLDPEKLSYFLPERTIEEGNLTFVEAKKILHERPNR